MGNSAGGSGIPLPNLVRSVLLTLGTSQVIPTNSNTTMIFDTIRFNTGAFVISANGQIVIPPGINWVRMDAQINFANNVTGIREALIERNFSESWAGRPVDLKDAIATDDVFLGMNPPVIQVIPGQAYSVQVFQNSGGNLNANGSGSGRACWFGMTALDM